MWYVLFFLNFICHLIEICGSFLFVKECNIEFETLEILNCCDLNFLCSQYHVFTYIDSIMQSQSYSAQEKELLQEEALKNLEVSDSSLNSFLSPIY